MLLTQLEYFVAVAREQHFGRAAAACFVSPSALSESLHKLETELGTPLVRRGRAFEGLTPEGELALVWARKVLASDRSLRDDLAAARGHLSSTVRLGVIPAAVSRAAEIVARLTTHHPLVRVTLRTGLTTEEIVRGIRDYELDAGLIHPAVDDASDLAVSPLYEDRMMVVGVDALITSDRMTMTGAELVGLPSCVLGPQMRARQALDHGLSMESLTLVPRVESDSVEALFAVATTGAAVAVVPESSVDPSHLSPRLRAVPLAEPEVTLSIALGFLADEPRPPVTTAIVAVLIDD
jgi:DNA-binding transcriptional LysR family regulator